NECELAILNGISDESAEQTLDLARKFDLKLVFAKSCQHLLLNADLGSATNADLGSETSCPHVATVSSGNRWPNRSSPCETCGDGKAAYACLVCQRAFCGGYTYGHAMEHYEDTKHSMVIRLSDLFVWCYSCASTVNSRKLDETKDYIFQVQFRSL
uniref:UBP-type domain-containing protein n=3 Tax=Bursaphelenchus xylophilus TaxID=6326 RepID=A0A1I7SPD3_BURXY